MTPLLQVAAIIQLLHGSTQTPVVNSGREPVRVTVTVARDTATQDRIGRPVPALVSPTLFALEPGERQLVRIRVREAFPSGTILRLVTTLTPLASPGDGTRLVLVSRLASKLIVE
jgi:hypothetical protein